MIYIKKLCKNHSIYFYLACFIFMFILSFNMTYNADEYNYSFITWSQTRISSISDIFQSQKLLYFNWTGRILVHSLIQLLLFIPRFFYAFFNSLVFTSFIYLILYISGYNKSIAEITFAFALILLLLPVFGETCIWISGSLNYLWPSTLFLFLVKLIKDSKTKLPLIMIIAFLAALTQEIVLICGFIYFSYKILVSKFNKKYILIFISFLAGGLLLISSPGNFVRASSTTSIITSKKICNTILGCILFLTAIIANFKPLLSNILDYIKSSKLLSVFKIISLIIFIMLLCINFLQFKFGRYPILHSIFEYKFVLTILSLYLFILLQVINDDIDSKFILESFNFELIGIVTALAMGVMPEFPTRSLFLASTFIIIGVLKLCNYYNQKLSIIKIITSPLAAIIILLLIKYYMFDLNSWNKYLDNRLSNAAGEECVTVEVQPPVPFIIANYYGDEPSGITITPNSITNYYCSKYYNVDNIIGVYKDHITLKIEKDNIDLSALKFKYTDKNGKVKYAYPDTPLLEPSKRVAAANEAYFSISDDARDIELINNSSISITSDNITKYSLN